MGESTSTRDIGGVTAPVAGGWEVDPNHTQLQFVARHMMVAKVQGTFGKWDIKLQIGERPEDSSVTAVIDTASIDSGVEDRDAHLRSGDFFDVEKYPHMTFTSTKIEHTGGTSFTVTGDFTVKDVTRPLTFDVEYEGSWADPWGGTRIAFTATSEIEREDWGVSWNVALEAGGWLVSKKVQIEVDLEAVHKADAPSA
jgi:polyisoprenoid-binding protein YceI